MTQYRNYVFTLNNYTELEIDALSQIECRYLCYGKEVGESLTPHLQGLVCFEHKKSLKQLKPMPGLARAHLEPMKGTFEQAKEYCQKEGQFTERGIPLFSQKEKGEANAQRWEAARQAVREKRIADIPADIGVHLSKLEYLVLREQLAERSLADTEEQMFWYYGPSGTGKSRKARTENPLAYLKMCNKWWDGYAGQDVVIIEDFDVEHKVLCHHLKIWADRYPFPAEVKGGKIDIRPKKIIITSNYHPSDIWTEDRDLSPILRRFKVISFPPPIFDLPFISKPAPISRLSKYADTFNPPEYRPATDGLGLGLDKYKDIEF